VQRVALVGGAEPRRQIQRIRCRRTEAHQLGEEQDARLPWQMLDEEGTTDKQLTQLAEEVLTL
jgi:ferritin-like metal-binding protein YciE